MHGDFVASPSDVKTVLDVRSVLRSNTKVALTLCSLSYDPVVAPEQAEPVRADDATESRCIFGISALRARIRAIITEREAQRRMCIWQPGPQPFT